MADAITFTPYLEWVDVPNPNEPPDNARFIAAADLKRYEIFGRDAAKLLNMHAVSLSGAVTRLDGLDTSLGAVNTSLGAVNTSLGAVNTRLNNSATGLDAKAPKASPTFTGTVSGITKAMVGLGNVDNTADTAKPVSTVQKAYIDAVGSRVATLESVRSVVAVRTTGLEINTTNQIQLFLEKRDVVIKANTQYQIEVTLPFFATAADTGGLAQVFLGVNTNSGIKTAGDYEILNRGFYSHPTAGSRADNITLFTVFNSIPAGTYRAALGFTRISGAGTLVLQGSTDMHGRASMVIRELGPV